jgi:hypothetical protein
MTGRRTVPRLLSCLFAPLMSTLHVKPFLQSSGAHRAAEIRVANTPARAVKRSQARQHQRHG